MLSPFPEAEVLFAEAEKTVEREVVSSVWTWVSLVWVGGES